MYVFVCVCVLLSVFSFLFLPTSFIAEKKMCLGPVLKLLRETMVLLADEPGRRHPMRVTVLPVIHALKAAGSFRTRTAGECTELLFLLLISNIV